MAFFKFHLTNGIKGKGAGHCDYINREGSYSNNKIAKELVAKGSINLPSWANTPREFFEMSDLYERANGTSYKAIDFALPCELTHEQNIRLTKKIINHIAKGKVATWAIHTKPAFSANVEQIHVHTMICERMTTDPPDKMKPPELFFRRYNEKDPEKGGYKKDERFRTIGKNKVLIKLREEIAEIINEAYRDAGLPIRISAKTLKEQKEHAAKVGDKVLEEFCDREPVKYLPMKLYKKLQKKIREAGLIDTDDMIPINPANNDKALNNLLESDLDFAEAIINRFETQIKKFRMLRKKAEADIRNLPTLLKNFNALSGAQMTYAVQSVGTELMLRQQQNLAYMNLVNSIYTGKENLQNFLRDYITHGKMKQARKAKTKLLKLEKQKDQLILIKDYYFDHPINRQIEAAKETLDKIVAEINEEVKDPKNRPHQVFASKKLSERFPSRKEKFDRCKKDNEKISVVIKDINSIINNLKQKPNAIFSKKFLGTIEGLIKAKDTDKLLENFASFRKEMAELNITTSQPQPDKANTRRESNQLER